MSDSTEQNFNKLFTIWKFFGVTVKQDPVIVVKCAEPGEFSHEYQQILARIEAKSKTEAMEKFNLLKTGI